ERAKEGKTGDAKGGGEEADDDRQRDPAAQSARQLPEAAVEEHQRHFSSVAPVRCGSDSVRGSATSTVRCSVGLGVAVIRATPSGASKRCHAPCGTMTSMPAFKVWVSGPASVMM